MTYTQKHINYYVVPGNLFLIYLLIQSNDFVFSSSSNFVVILFIGYILGIILIEPLGTLLRCILNAINVSMHILNIITFIKYKIIAHKFISRSSAIYYTQTMKKKKKYKSDERFQAIAFEEAMYVNLLVAIILLIIINNENMDLKIIIFLVLICIKYLILESYAWEKIKEEANEPKSN